MSASGLLLQFSVRRFAVVAVGVLVSACRSSSPPSGSTTAPFTFTVDSAVTPNSPSITGKNGTVLEVGAVRDAHGITSDFTVDELVFRPKNAADLASMLSRYGATIVEDDHVPVRPGSIGLSALGTTYRLRLNGHALPTVNLAADARTVGLMGAHIFSSDAVARLVATVVHEVAYGNVVAPNVVMHSDGGPSMIYGSKECNALGQPDAFLWSEYNGSYVTGSTSRATVAGAMQLLEGVGYTPQSVTVAIIDGGFWLISNDGSPNSRTGIGTDFPKHIPLQYSFLSDTYDASGPNGNTCTNGESCPWHGNNSAGVALGALYDGNAAAGTGGQVSVPMLMAIDGTHFETIRAVNTAVDWGADVINLSFGSPCNDTCLDFVNGPGGYEAPFERAISSNIILVASAGNSKLDVSDQHIEPCTLPSVICVGALDSKASPAVSAGGTSYAEGPGYNTSAPYSNYGSGVTIWAPGYVRVMPTPSTAPYTLGFHNGTSASSPYVAGVVAMMKAIMPAMTPAEATSILLKSAYADSPDPHVSRYLDARGALLATPGGAPAPDTYEPNDTKSSATLIASGDTHAMTFDSLTDTDYLSFSINDFGSVTFTFANMSEGLGNINFGLFPLDGQALPDDVVQGPWRGPPNAYFEPAPTTGYKYLGGLLAPGAYGVALHGFPQPYQFTFTSTATGLQPDQFEVNDTMAEAKVVPQGVFDVTLHTTTDVDWYVLTVPSVADAADYWFTFQLEDSDFPLTLDVYDTNGVLVMTSQDPSPTATFDETSAGKEVFLKVTSGGEKTRYTIEDGIVERPGGRQYANAAAHIARINPGDPGGAQRVLRSVDQWLLYQRSDAGQLGAAIPAKALELEGAYLHIDAYRADDGSLLTSGVPKAAAQLPGEHVDVTGVGFNAEVLLHVTRTEALEPSPPEVNFFMPKINYTITAQ